MHDGTTNQCAVNNVWKRCKNRNLQFPFFSQYDLLYDKKFRGRTSAEHHYETRLFETLAWIQVYKGTDAATPYTRRVATPVPKSVCLQNFKDASVFEIVCGSKVKLRTDDSKVQISWEQFNFVMPTSNNDPSKRIAAADEPMWVEQLYEEVCKWLERSFTNSRRCECCEIADERDRCPWCYQAFGWHRTAV